jgi:cellulose synthase operon protein B
VETKKMKHTNTKSLVQSFLFVTLLLLNGLSAAQKSATTAVTSNPPSSGQASAQSSTQLSGDPAILAGNNRVVSLTGKQLGAWTAIQLRGTNVSRTLAFTIRADETVVAAKLKFTYDYSPAILADQSHFKILINEKIAYVDPLPAGKGVGMQREYPLDPNLFKDYNEIRLNLIGKSTSACSDPKDASVWLTVNEGVSLELTLAPSSKQPDLKHLPAPFFDKLDPLPLQLPFVFSANPSLSTLKAAGIVASWFGIQAGTRGAKFPVFLNELPTSHAVIFLNGNEDAAGYKSVTGPGIFLQKNPKNANAHLLIINGGNELEITRAAKTLALLTNTLAGQNASLTNPSNEVDFAPRLPYDAPAWVRTDRPMKLGELAKLQDLKVQGYEPDAIRINYRVSPDVFTWRTGGAPLHLKYRSIRLPEHKSSSLGINLNNNYIDTIAINDTVEKKSVLNTYHVGSESVREKDLQIPPYSLGGRDQLQLLFTFDVKQRGDCQAMPPDNFIASVDAESTIDFSQFPKYAALPNLEFFANIGFPYTRLADLSQTSVVLPERASVEEIGLYLAVMAKMGESTGYPAIRHSVVGAGDLSKSQDHDLIVIGSGQNQRLLTAWKDQLPMLVQNGIRRVREPNANARPLYRWEQSDIDPSKKPQGGISLSGDANLVTLMGFESPLKPTRSVVFLYADKAKDMERITDLIADPERLTSIQGDFVVVSEKSAKHAKVSDTYYLGEIPWAHKVRWFLADNPILVAFIALIVALLSAAVIYRPLKFLGGSVFKKKAL